MFWDEEKGGGKNPSKKLRVGSSLAAVWSGGLSSSEKGELPGDDKGSSEEATSTSKLHQDKLHCFFHYRTSYKRQTLFRCKLFEYNNKKVFTLKKLTGILAI